MTVTQTGNCKRLQRLAERSVITIIPQLGHLDNYKIVDGSSKSYAILMS